MSRRIAVVVGIGQYQDPILQRLVASTSDIHALAGVLSNSEIGRFDEVKVLQDVSVEQMRRQLARTFRECQHDDVLFVFYAGHGIIDDKGRLYLAAADTEREYASATALPASFLFDELERCLADPQVLVLDCWHGAVFSRATKTAVGDIVGIGTQFQSTGKARFVLSAMDATYAFEREGVTGTPIQSVFAAHLVRALTSGAADLDGDGTITVDELYEFLHREMAASTPRQLPERWSFNQQDDVVIGWSPLTSSVAASLPAHVIQAMTSSHREVRLAVVGELARIANSGHQGRAAAARAALTELSDDDSRIVSIKALAAIAQLDGADSAMGSFRDAGGASPVGNAGILDDDVQFTVYRPNAAPPRVWQTLLAFAHKSKVVDGDDPFTEVHRQAQALLGNEADRFERLTQESTGRLRRGTQLLFAPWLERAEINPTTIELRWDEPVHRADFRFRIGSDVATGERLRGGLRVFVGSLIVGEITFAVGVSSGEPSEQPRPISSPRFRKIFASYSHDDSDVVSDVRRYSTLMGDEYLIDVQSLRSGERWQERIASLIEEADVFQLFWSWNSLRSRFVLEECDHALSLGRDGFIRPVYWQVPLPTSAELPPAAIRSLHFSCLALNRREAKPARDEAVCPDSQACAAPADLDYPSALRRYSRSSGRMTYAITAGLVAIVAAISYLWFLR